MFSWFRRNKPKLQALPSGGGQGGLAVDLAFTDGIRSWSEHFDLIEVARRVLEQCGHKTTTKDKSIEHIPSGLTIKPALDGLTPIQGKGAQTVTTIEVSHPVFGGQRICEYQHATGDSAEASVTQGFEQWAKMDLVTLLDSLRPMPEECTMLDMRFPADDYRPARNRRAILGPVSEFCERPRPSSEASAENNNEAEHDFCPCCLLTHTFEAFKEFIEDDRFFGIRLLAMRDANGSPAADCRVNGEEWEIGKEALRNYVSSWPDAGFEFRKQYVVLKSVESVANSPN